MKRILWVCAWAAGLMLLLSACRGHSCTITYDWGYDGRTEMAMAEKGSLISPVNPFRVGYTFDGWSVADALTVDTAVENTESTADGEMMEPPPVSDANVARWDPQNDRVKGDLILRALWKPKSDTVYLDAGGADCDVRSVQFYFGQPVCFPDVTRAGYELDGWYCAGIRFVGNEIWQGNPAFGNTIQFTARWTTFPPGMTVTFGTYEQDNDRANGKEPIEWLVLDYRDGQYLLLSRYILDAGGYDDQDSSPGTARPWSSCFLRTWLNETFYRKAFSVKERAAIRESSLVDTQTRDRLFLLSHAEAEHYMLHSDDSVGRSTPYAKARGLEINNGDELNPEFSWWWLRSPREGEAPSYDGGSWGYSNSGRSRYGIRPALWVDEDAVVS